MAQFDPRRQPLRFAPHLITAAAALVVSTLVWKVVQPAAPTPAATPDLDPTAIAALETRAFAAASARPGLADPQNVLVKLKPGETVAQAVVRLGVAAEDAQAAARTLAQANVRAITAFQAAIAKPLNGAGAARLIGLTLRTSPATSLTLSRSYDGVMKLRELQERVSDETTVAHGRVAGSLFQSAAALGATSQVTNQVVKLFQHKLDFARDITSGDQFTMVFDRRVTESGRTVEIGHLLFASLQAHGKWVSLYRFERDGKVEYFDETGKNIKAPAAADAGRRRPHDLDLRHADASDPGLHAHAPGRRLRRADGRAGAGRRRRRGGRRRAAGAATATGCASAMPAAGTRATATCPAMRAASTPAWSCTRARWWPMSA